MNFSRADLRAQTKLHYSKVLSSHLIYHELKKVVGNDASGPRTIRNWTKHFESKDSSLDKGLYPGKVKTATDEEHVAKVMSIIEMDRRPTISEIASKVPKSIESMWTILHKHLNLSLRCARWIPNVVTMNSKNLSPNVSRKSWPLFCKWRFFFLGKF